MSEKMTGYGYFPSVDALQTAVDAREGDKKGNAVIYEGAEIKDDGKEVRVEGNPTRVLKVRVYPNGDLDIRADDSFDNE